MSNQATTESTDTPVAEANDSSSVERLEDKLAEHRAALETAEKAFLAAGKSGKLDEMLSAGESVKTAKRNLERVENELKRLTWETRNAERMERSVQLKEAVDSFMATVNVGELHSIGITGVNISFADGKPTVNVTAERPPSTGGKGRKSSEPGSGPSRVRWVYDGQEYSSRDLLQTFGGEEGELAIRRASKNPDDPESWLAKGQKFSPGFDQPVKALARRMGWDGNETEQRQLSQLPG